MASSRGLKVSGYLPGIFEVRTRPARARPASWPFWAVSPDVVGGGRDTPHSVQCPYQHGLDEYDFA